MSEPNAGTFPRFEIGLRRRFSELRAAMREIGLLAVGFIVLSVPVGAQISPGALARAHQSLTGDTNCVKCHTLSARSQSYHCVECHREIGAELEHNRGLHATFPRSSATGSPCVKCHSDHNGVDFQMLHWDPTPSGFDHSKTGYVLDGKHAGVSCRTCHNAKHISMSERGILSGKDLNHTWMGLSASCTTCHEDKHQGRFGATCTQCHSTVDWKTTKIEEQGFDHSKTNFPLTGAHRRVACEKCHIAGSDGKPRWADIPATPCTACHTDPHKGEFKRGCASCHNTSNWLDLSGMPKFDHSKTNYPLVGKHIEVPCASCHTQSDFKAPVAHATCTDCHKDDPHSGQFLKRPDGGRCESCHTVEGWSPSTFSAADHAKTQFPLVSPHAEVKCAQCHIPAGKATKFKVRFDLCIDCHKDEHAGQFAEAPWSNRCEKCHTGAKFTKTSYTLENHQKTLFPLTGGHMAVACNDCHKKASPSEVVLYHFPRLSCTSCHQDVHHGEFAGRMAEEGINGKPKGCEVCHSTEDWKNLARFDHSQTKFPLLGSHRAVACIDCHKPPNLELTMSHVDFRSASTACSDCHENPHADQFGERKNSCESCHSTFKWKPSLFDHNKTSFPLKGGHEGVACSACHTLHRSAGGKDVLFYKPTPSACSACHGETIPVLKQE